MKIENSSSIPPLPLGYKLASNTILKLLGQGASGATYLVSDVRAEGDVSVIKESLPADLAYREESTLQILPKEASGEGVEKLRAAQEAFTSEAKALEAIHHPSIVAVSRVFSALGTTYITMEYLPGFTVAEWCRRNGAPTREQLVYLLSTLLSALSHLHSKDLAHGDLREEHVRFRENGVPVLIDFGVARKAIQASGSNAELSTLKRSAEDLYALGAMARRMITGESANAATRSAPLAKNSKLVSAYGRSLLAGIDKAMNTNEGKGWANADEWLDAVKGRLFSAQARRFISRVAWGSVAVGVLSVGTYQVFQALWDSTDETSLVRELTPQEKAQLAYTEGMSWLTDQPTRVADPTKAIPLLRQAAELGHADAMWTLVECYTEGKVVEPAPEEAFHWCLQTVGTANPAPEAYYLLACLYREGSGTEKDDKAAMPYLLKAAEAGLVDAQFDLAGCYTTGEGGRTDLAEAAKWLTEAGNQGHTGAMMELARRYREGKAGITFTSHQQSLEWYNKAAQAGVPEAWYHVALAHWDGSGTPQNREEAASCFRKAAELGVPEAAFRLGAGIVRGEIRGTAEEAEQFLKQSADKGSTDAQRVLADLYVRGINGKRNEAAAVPYYLQAAQAGDVNATCSLAQLWLSGYREGCSEATLRELLDASAEKSSRAKQFSALLPGVPREKAISILKDLAANADDSHVKADAMASLGLMQTNDAIAMDYYKAAANNGSPLGEALLAYAALMGDATGDEASDALRLLTRGADSRAPYRPVLLSCLGEVYLKGKGVPQDTEKGIALLEQAAATGELRSLHMLATCYWDGSFGLQQDKEKALETYRRAASAGSPKATIFLGHYFFTGEEGREPDLAAAEPYLHTAAQMEDARSMYEYACCLRTKETPDYEAVAEWAGKACDAGVPEAMLMLCGLCEAGQGVEQDAGRAHSLLTRYADTITGKPAPEAAAAWDVLGTMYNEGTGTEKDAKKARECWSKSADAKHPMGQFHYGVLLYTEGKNKTEKERGKSLIKAAATAKEPVQEAVDYVAKHFPTTAKPSNNNRNNSRSSGNRRKR